MAADCFSSAVKTCHWGVDAIARWLILDAGLSIGWLPRGTTIPSGGDKASHSDPVEVHSFNVARQFALHPFDDRSNQWEMIFKKIRKRIIFGINVAISRAASMSARLP
jgi:hypothetical protein